MLNNARESCVNTENIRGELTGAAVSPFHCWYFWLMVKRSGHQTARLVSADIKMITCHISRFLYLFLIESKSRKLKTVQAAVRELQIKTSESCKRDYKSQKNVDAGFLGELQDFNVRSVGLKYVRNSSPVHQVWPIISAVSSFFSSSYAVIQSFMRWVIYHLPSVVICSDVCFNNSLSN